MRDWKIQLQKGKGHRRWSQRKQRGWCAPSTKAEEGRSGFFSPQRITEDIAPCDSAEVRSSVRKGQVSSFKDYYQYQERFFPESGWGSDPGA